jgi:hypothetical protein
MSAKDIGLTDETAHLIKEYQANAARMRVQANSVRSLILAQSGIRLLLVTDLS